MKWAIVISLSLGVFHNTQTHAGSGNQLPEAGSCIASSELKTLLASKQQSPILMMNKIDTKLGIPMSLKEKFTSSDGTTTKERWQWLLSYQQTLNNFDAIARRYDYSDERKSKGYQIIKKLRDSQLSKGKITKVETGTSAMIITASNNLDAWGLWLGNQPLGESPSQYCLLFSGKRFLFYDYLNHSSKGRTAITFEKLKAEDECIDLPAPSYQICHSRQESLSNLADQQYFVATNAIANQGKIEGQAYTGNLLISLAVNPNTGDAELMLTGAEGATISLYKARDFQFLPILQNALVQ